MRGQTRLTKCVAQPRHRLRVRVHTLCTRDGQAIRRSLHGRCVHPPKHLPRSGRRRPRCAGEHPRRLAGAGRGTWEGGRSGRQPQRPRAPPPPPVTGRTTRPRPPDTPVRQCLKLLPFFGLVLLQSDLDDPVHVPLPDSATSLDNVVGENGGLRCTTGGGRAGSISHWDHIVEVVGSNPGGS